MTPNLSSKVTVSFLATAVFCYAAETPARAAENQNSAYYVTASNKTASAPPAVSQPGQQSMAINLPAGCTLEGDDGSGVYGFRNTDGKRGYCDAKGAILIKPTDDDIRSVGEKRFIKHYYDDVQEVTELIGPGDAVIATLPKGKLFFGDKFCDGLLRVQTPVEEVTGYLNRDGKFQIKPERYVRGKDFSSGFAQIELRGHGYKTFTALINRTGKIVFGPLDSEKGESVSEFWEGKALVDTQTGEGILDKSLKYIVPPIYQTVRMTNDNVYFAKRDGQWCVLSLKGKELKVFPKQVTNVRSENADGNWIYAVGEDAAQAQEADSECSPKQSKEGVMSPKGKVLIEPKYEQIFEYADGKAVAGVKKESRWLLGMIGSDGKVLLPFEYQRLTLKDSPASPPVKTTKNGFSSEYFRTYTTNRLAQWKAFLEDFDLIGMDEAEVYRLLGKPDDRPVENSLKYPKLVTYSTLSGFCGNAWQGIRIQFDEQKKVSRWCGAQFRGQDGWNTENVVFVKTKGGYWSEDNGRLVPKSVANEYEVTPPATTVNSSIE